MVPWLAQKHQTSTILQGEKTVKFQKPKKHWKIWKKGINVIGPAECADRGEDYGGGRRHAKTGEIWKKWKTEVEAKDGEKNLEDATGI